MQKLYELRRYVKFQLYTVGEYYVLQLFNQDVEPNDLDVDCVWENDNISIEELLDEAIEWCKERYGKQL